ncbi:uncharacterized protein BCR38DRAFT_407455 [Pseudomassariella vexata]|uniref:Uncharacterized protein n=1 Tax=Pseudomassariella vexata TaxID=1141098 RepID=A0A1Y2E7D9_9PEZI|nr:uncharacterized protein BCR38DRAFT_407455 [Pseudomassariella vexata]ORY67478.1 hypothetical protein BCR38DRAFT_407455 [Pseudomassariella vexata]
MAISTRSVYVGASAAPRLKTTGLVTQESQRQNVETIKWFIDSGMEVHNAACNMDMASAAYYENLPIEVLELCVEIYPKVINEPVISISDTCLKQAFYPSASAAAIWNSLATPWRNSTDANTQRHSLTVTDQWNVSENTGHQDLESEIITKFSTANLKCRVKKYCIGNSFTSFPLDVNVEATLRAVKTDAEFTWI